MLATSKTALKNKKIDDIMNAKQSAKIFKKRLKAQKVIVNLFQKFKKETAK